jgi:integrase
LRHTTASLAISAGANVKVVQRMLGHATAAMTLDLYGHLLDDDLAAVADALGKAIQTTAVSLRNSADNAEEPELLEIVN